MSWLRNICHTVANFYKEKLGRQFIITKLDSDDVLLERYHLIFPFEWKEWAPFNLYLHRFHASDKRVLHDHPWHWASLMLTGGYTEHSEKPWGASGTFIRPGMLRFHKAEDAHYLTLQENISRNLGITKPGEPYEVWTLMFIGRRFREWGFLTNAGWVSWIDYLAKHRKQ